MAITRLNNNSITSITALPSAVAVANTPMWKAYMTSSQSLAYNTATKVNFNATYIDTNSGYDTTNKRFTVPSGQGGKYFIHSYYRTGTGTDSQGFSITLYKNGSSSLGGEDGKGHSVNQSYNTISFSAFIDLSAGDYVEIYASQGETNATFDIGYSTEAMFFGYRIIE